MVRNNMLHQGLVIEEAERAGDIIWENLEIISFLKFVRGVAVVLAMALLVWGSYSLQASATNLQYSIEEFERIECGPILAQPIAEQQLKAYTTWEEHFDFMAQPSLLESTQRANSSLSCFCDD